MRQEIVIGVDSQDIEDVTRAICDITGWEYEGHDSSYLGEYDLFTTPEEVMVKYNFVDAEGEWDFPDHRQFAVLVVVAETVQPHFFSSPSVEARLSSKNNQREVMVIDPPNSASEATALKRVASI